MDREEKIRSLAYSIWENEGHPHGRDMEHWLKAETIFDAETRQGDRREAVRTQERKRGRSSRPAQKQTSH